MKRHFNRWVVIAALVAAPAAYAQDFRADNRVLVTPVAGGFQVNGGGGWGARGMWCAAADYARDVLGALGAARLYVRDPARPGGRAVFTLDPTGLTPRAAVVTAVAVQTPGASLSVDHAYSFCIDARINNR